MAEQNPDISIAGNTYDFYWEIFVNFMLPKVCFTYWDINNNLSDEFKYWPEAVKMDHFIETCWKQNYEDDARAKVIFNLL